MKQIIEKAKETSVKHIIGRMAGRLRAGALLLLCVLLLCVCPAGIVQAEEGTPGTASAQEKADPAPDYTLPSAWAYLETDIEKDADCFLICPTVYLGDGEHYNMSLQDSASRKSFVGALNMEYGLYALDCRMYAPFYRQMSLDGYECGEAARATYEQIAYQDVREAFLYYREHYNQGRPIVLAGFSQGADMCIRLMKEFGAEPDFADQLIACYAIGWRLTEEEIRQYPYLKAAQGERDTGVIIAFNSEAKSINGSLMVPEGTKTLAINPLNWKTDGTYAPAEENQGACFTNYKGEIKKEIPQLTGAYLDSERGTLKMDDTITPQEYPPVLGIFEDGIYHLYDYQFFYRNIQSNVLQRIHARMTAAQAAA